MAQSFRTSTPFSNFVMRTERKLYVFPSPAVRPVSIQRHGAVLPADTNVSQLYYLPSTQRGGYSALCCTSQRTILWLWRYCTVRTPALPAPNSTHSNQHHPIPTHNPQLTSGSLIARPSFNTSKPPRQHQKIDQHEAITSCAPARFCQLCLSNSCRQQPRESWTARKSIQRINSRGRQRLRAIQWQFGRSRCCGPDIFLHPRPR